MKPGILALLMASAAVNLAMAQETPPIAPEIVSNEESIAPGPNIFITEGGTPGNVTVFGAGDLALKGNVTAGQGAQLAVSKDGGKLYTASHYYKRIVAGPDDPVLQEWDTNTLSLVREIPISDRFVIGTNQPTMTVLTADEDYVLIQNATPATSVSVVSLEKGEMIAEIPTPGCWTIMPAPSGNKFSTICGDGTFATYTFTADGAFSEPVKSEPFFDPDADPVFTSPAVAGDTMVFASFNGNLLVVDRSGDVPVVTDKFSITDGVEGGWAPGGGEVVAYNAPANVAFVLMHPDAKEGSHKDPAKEIWAVDLGAKKTLYRSPANGEATITASQAEVPVVYAGGDGAIRLYDADPEAKYALKVAVETKGFGGPGAIWAPSE